MIPILYPVNSSEFLSNGLGALSDVLSCEVSEERNGAFELQMVYPIDGIHFSDIRNSSIIKAIPSDGANPQLFTVYKITKPMNGRCTIFAQHISYRLSFIPVDPFEASSAAETFLRFPVYARENCPFTFWTDVTTASSYSQDYPESIRARLGGQRGSVLDQFGGEYEWDNYTVKLYAHRGHDNGVTLRYGKNITDIQQEENIEETYTGVYPYYYQEGTLITLPEKIVYSPYADRYPYKRTKTVDFTDSFPDGAPTVEQLRAKAQTRASNIGIPSVNIRISFVALWQTEEYKDIAALERVHLCDTVHIFFEKLGIETTAKVISTTYDVLKERYTEIELGDAKSTLTDSIAEAIDEIDDKPDKSFMDAAIQNATEWITGNNGGNVVIIYNGNNEPIELLIMDTDDILTAQKVWRWNLGGLGFSNNGYNGPYETAITQDGAIVADFITAGTLNAGVVKTGILTDRQNKNYWNMDTGAFQLSASATVGGSAIATQAQITVLDGKITSEVTRAQGVEGNLSSRISQNADEISSEVSRANGVEVALSSRITQNANAITLKVSKGDVSSEISQEAGAINISANRLTIDSTNFKLSASGVIQATNAVLSGKITATQGSIGGFTIGSNALYTNNAYSIGSVGVHVGNDGLSVAGSSNKALMKSDGTMVLQSNAGLTITPYNPSGSYWSTVVSSSSVKVAQSSSTYSELGQSIARFYSTASLHSEISYNNVKITDNSGNVELTTTSLASTRTFEVSSSGALKVSTSNLLTLGKTGCSIAFFGAGTGSSKKTVSKLPSSATLATTVTKLNALIDALNAYNLIGV